MSDDKIIDFGSFQNKVKDSDIDKLEEYMYSMENSWIEHYRHYHRPALLPLLSLSEKHCLYTYNHRHLCRYKDSRNLS